MICGVAGGRPAILEGELPEAIENARERVPVAQGIAASSTACSLRQVGPSATAGLQGDDSPNHRLGNR
jgi:hypothetical protein